MFWFSALTATQVFQLNQQTAKMLCNQRHQRILQIKLLTKVGLGKKILSSRNFSHVCCQDHVQALSMLWAYGPL